MRVFIIVVVYMLITPVSAWPDEIVAPVQPPSPPPHVMIMRTEQLEVRIVVRDGWQRTEYVTEGYSHIGVTGVAERHRYAIVFDAAGEPTAISVERGIEPVPEKSLFDMTDTVLGEHCQVWASARQFSLRIPRGPMLHCITDDGVTLWTGISNRNGVQILSRAVELERRPVAWSEITPPRQFFSWSVWARHFALSPEGEAPAYEVRYGDSIQRTRGALTFRTWRDGHSLHNGNARLTYGARGDTASFAIDLDEPAWPHPPAGGSEVMDRPRSRVLGERCRWHRVDLAVQWGIVSRCVNRDGALLAEATDFHDPALADEYEEATYYRRGAPAAALMLPADDVFEPWLAALPE